MNFETEGQKRLWDIKNISIIIIPSCILYLAFSLQGAKGPFWLGNLFEAEYTYLMNSLAISQGLQVQHADHPGSTLQLLGGILLHVVHFISGKEDLALDVLVRSEFYLSSLYGILLLFLFLTLTLAGILVIRWSGDYMAAILLQAAIPLSYSTRHFALPRMKPEHLLLILAIWMSIVILYHYRLYKQRSKKEPVWQYGLLTGLGIGSKITFVPLAFLPLVLLKGIKNRLWYIAVSLIVFFAVTANPLMNFSGFKKFLLGHLVAREGYNKPIIEGSSKVQAMFQGVERLFYFIQKNEPILLWAVGVLLVSGLILIFVKNFNKSVQADSFLKRLWLGLLIVFFTQFFLVANGPNAKSHYIIPAAGLIGLAAFLSWRWPVAALEKEYQAQLTYKIVYLSIFFTLAFSVISKIPHEIHSLERESASWLEAHQFKTENKLANLPTVYYYQSSDIQYALAFGNYLSNTHFSGQLSELYPDCYMFHIWSRTLFGSFGDEILKLDDIIDKSGSVLVQGSNRYPPIIPGLESSVYPSSQKRHYRRSGAVIPTRTDSPFSAEVLFNGTKEWLVLVKPAGKNDTDN